MTKLFCSKTNQAVTLTVSIASSGEGEVWQTDRPGMLAKIYHVPASHEKEKLAQMKDRVAKLEVMVKRVPKDPNAHQNHISFAWPRSLLKNSGGEVVGFLMAEVENSLDLLKVCTPRMRKSLGVDANWYFLHVVARNIAGIIQAIHDEGYVLGDIKLQNILVNNRALPTIIDTDSFQVVDPVQNKVYRCLVASEGFTPSELIGKDIDSITQSAIHDRFRLSVVIYYLLFGGPPFRGSWQGSGDPPEQVELIRRGLWPYAPNSLIQPNHNTIPLDIIHPELQRCFLLCFNDGHFDPSKRPSARVWLGALEVAFNELQSCGKVDSHFYGLSYGRCYWCDRAKNSGVDIFQKKLILTAINSQTIQNSNQNKKTFIQLSNTTFGSSKSAIYLSQNKKQQKSIKQGKFKNSWFWKGFKWIIYIFLIIFSGLLALFIFYVYQYNNDSTLFDKALDINDGIKDFSTKDLTYKLSQINEALNIANQVQDPSRKISALSAIAITYSKLNRLDQANNLLNKALNIANQIQDSSEKSSALKDIAESYAELNQLDKANNLLSKALNLANQITDPESKARQLMEIAWFYVKLNQLDKATDLLNTAFSVSIWDKIGMVSKVG